MTVYRVTEVIGTSATSWEEAAAEAISRSGRTVLVMACAVRGGVSYRLVHQA